MAPILQKNILKCIFFNENVRILIKISLILRIQLTILQIASGNCLVPIRWHAIIWTNDGWITDAYMHYLASVR